MMLLDVLINGAITALPRQVGLECSFDNGQDGTCMETKVCGSQGGSSEAGKHIFLRNFRAQDEVGIGSCSLRTNKGTEVTALAE